MANLFREELQCKEMVDGLEVIQLDSNTAYLDDVVDKLFQCETRQQLLAMIQEVYDDGFEDGTKA